MISSGRRRRQDARGACEEDQDLLASISARFLRLTIRRAQPGSRRHGYLILQICDFSWKIPLYRADPQWECVHSWGVRARRNSLTEHMWRATGGLRGFRSCVGGAGPAPTPLECWREIRGRIWASSRAMGDLEQGSHAGSFSGPSRPEPPWSHFQAPLVASRARGPGPPLRPRDLDRPGLSAHARISVRPPSR
jgi:hypothetical protein